MLQTILKYLPVLAVAIFVNIALGLFNNIENLKENFDWRKLVSGLIKAICVSLSFIGTSYCFDATGAVIDIGIFDINPELIMISAIILYLGKDLENLYKIFKLDKLGGK